MTLQSARYLITTADERTWKFDRPVIFLGEWCRLYERRHIWQGMDAIVAEPYGLGQAKKDADHIEARALNERLFVLVCEVLNSFHGTQRSARFWRIVLGHWLHRYVDVMLNRVRTLEQCLQSHQISGTTIYSNGNFSLAMQDSYTAIFAFNDDRWNSVLTGRILDLLGAASFPVEVIPDIESLGFRFNVVEATVPLKIKLLRWGYQWARKLAPYLARDSDGFIINSYLPKKEEIKLQLALGQCPQSWTSPKLEASEKSDGTLRKDLSCQVAPISGSDLGNILSKMLFELLPICFLEGFDNLNKIVEEQSWPTRPKFIFTSNNFDTDEVFKIYTANKIEKECEYFVGQHGNNYGVSRNHLDPSIEEVSADKFLTWGWTDGLPQHIPCFVFKTAGRKAENYNPQGGLLLIELCLTHRITTWDDTAEFTRYFDEQQSFIRALDSNPRKGLTVRLHAGYRYQKWSDESRWKAFDPSLKIDIGDVAIRDVIAQSRIVIHSYDSTGILETLSQNIPTMAFWNNGLDHLRDSAKPYYQLLVDAGIVHLTPESVAHKVNEVWDDIGGWWRQSKVQDARKQFCDRYARLSQCPVRELKNTLLR